MGKKQIELADRIISLHDEISFSVEQDEEIDKELHKACLEYVILGQKIKGTYSPYSKEQKEYDLHVKRSWPGKGFPGPEYQREG